MQVLITGAAGKLGQILQAAWADGEPRGFQPVWSVRHTPGSDCLQWDILSGPAPAIPKGCIILHFAGQLRGNASALAANAEMALRVYEVAKEVGAKHVFFASSAAIYGPSSSDLLEIHAPDPRSDYGRSKLDMEREVLCWAHHAGREGPGVTCLRIGNVLGADGLFGQLKAGCETVLDAVPGQDGGLLRSYIGPGEFARTLEGLTGRVKANACMPTILNVATPGAVFMADLLSAANIPFRVGPPNPSVNRMVSLSTKRLAALVPLRPMQAADMVQEWRELVVRLP